MKVFLKQVIAHLSRYTLSIIVKKVTLLLSIFCLHFSHFSRFSSIELDFYVGTLAEPKKTLEKNPNVGYFEQIDKLIYSV